MNRIWHITVLLSFTSFFGGKLFGQNNKLIDSLNVIIETSSNDSLVVSSCLQMATEMHFAEKETPPYLETAEKRALKINDKGLLSEVYNSYGAYYAYLGDLEKSEANFLKTLKYAYAAQNKESMAAGFIGLCNINRIRGDLVAALDYALKAEKVYLDIDDPYKLAVVYGSIGLIFKIQGQHTKALDYYKKGLILARSVENLFLESAFLDNMGSVYQQLAEYEKALDYHLQAAEIKVEINDRAGLGRAYGNMAMVYLADENDDSALFYFEKSLVLFKETGFEEGIFMAYSSMADIYNHKNDHKRAIKYLEDSESMAESGEQLKYLADIKLKLANLYAAINKPDLAFKSLKESIEISDSIKIKDQENEMHKMELDFEYNQKRLEDSLLLVQNEKINAIKVADRDKEIKLQKTIIITSVFVLVLVLLLLFFLFKSNARQKKLNSIINEQKSEVEDQNKEIRDSINYAKRLQDGILPPISFIENSFEDHFLIYYPKDIVAGDFYWFEETENYKFIAVADCTGHGVPGAMVSVIGANALSRSVLEYGIRKPGEILDSARKLILETFAKSETEVKDGMDISILTINKKTNAVEWSGAHNPLWIYRAKSGELEIIKGDKQPVGVYQKSQPFNSLTIEVNSGDWLYLFTDGMQDQFGGINAEEKRFKGKKLKPGPIRKAIIESHQNNPSQQKVNLERLFINWRGMQEQVDDVTFMGLKIIG